MISADTKVVLWTGGWDSTYRVLQLVVKFKVKVQPVYLIDMNRKSFPLEIATMHKIKKAVQEEYPHTAGLILPTEFYLIEDIPIDSDVTENFDVLLRQQYLGGQYKHFANLIKSKRVGNLELSIHKDDRAHAFLDGYTKAKTDSITGSTYMLDSSKAPEELSIFKGLSFPIFNITKTDMLEAAKQDGFYKFMLMTWFCFNPVGGKMACGRCNPCRYAKAEDMGWRVPRFPYLVLLRQKVVVATGYVRTALLHR